MAANQSGNPKEKITEKVFRSKWMKAVSAMAAVVVFVTTYSLMLPAITLSSQDAKCGYEEHTHTEECYDAEGNIICGFEEHVHSLACYSDLYADIENADEWVASVPALSGDRNSDVVAVAESQIGYRESDSNYLVSDENQTQGYTRYGHWYGDVADGSGERLENGLSTFAYADWNAMFASFVLNHAGIEDFGYDSDVGNWAGALAVAGKYADAADYMPEAGDLIFYTPELGSDIRVGIVTGTNKRLFGLFGDITSISVISGDSDNSVEEVRVSLADINEGDVTFETIHGYGVMSPKSGEAEDVSVAESARDDSEANDASLITYPADATTAAQAEAALNAEENADLPVQEELPADLTAADVDNTESTVESVDAVQAEVMPEEVQEAADAEVQESEQILTDESSLNGTDAVENAADTSDSNNNASAALSDDTNHVIGAAPEDLETIDEVATGSVSVNAAQTSGISEDGTAIVMDWQIATQLEEGVLPAGAVIRVDTATGKMHAMTIAQAKAWAGSAVLGGEEVSLVDNDNYEVMFIGDNDHLYTWADVQAMDDDAVTAFVGIHVKAVNEVEIADGTITMYFETSASLDSANTGRNYYVTKVNVNGLTGTGSFVYENGIAVQADQNRVLRDAGLDYEPEMALTANGSDYTVIVTYDADAGIPESAKLKVTEVLQGTDEHSKYLEDAKKALGIGEDDVDFYGRFFDIKIMTTEGEYTPKAPVKVDIRYNDAIDVADVDEVNAVHFAKEGVEQVYAETEESGGRIESVGFTADSFSVYGIIYTVDFEYDGFTYSIEGGDSIKLSELVEILGIAGKDKWFKTGAEFVDNVEEAAFSDENLISLERDGVLGTGIFASDWILTSKGPFNTVETLKLTMNDGKVYNIKVTDESVQDVSGLLTGVTATINGAEVDSDNWDINIGETYKLNFTFQEQKNGTQFINDDGVMVYTLPKGIIMEEGESGTFTMSFGRLGELTDNTYTISKNSEGRYVVNIRWNTSDETNFNYLKAAAEAKYTLELYGYFDGSETEYNFSEDITKTAELSEYNDAEVKKSGSYDSATGKINYTVTINVTGRVDEVTVKDRISGDALNINRDVKAYGRGDRPLIIAPMNLNYITSDDKTTGFDLKLTNLTSGTYTVQYTADVDKTMLEKSGKTIFSDTGNEVSIEAEPDGNPNNNTDNNYEFEINYSKTDKNATKVGDIQEDEGGRQYRIVDWKIEVNNEREVSIAGSKIKDTITTPNTMEYYGTGITVSAFNGTSTDVRTVPWNSSDMMAVSSSSWTYNVPSTDGIMSYVITYQTKAYVDSDNDITVTNNVETEKGSKQGTAIIPHDDSSDIKATKTHTAANNEYIDWTIIVNVPATGASELVVEDFVPTHQSPVQKPGGGEYYYYDTLDTGSFEVIGTTDNETWGPITYTKAGEDGTQEAEDPDTIAAFKMTFKNSGADGLEATGENRTITISYRTYVNQDWLDQTENAAWYNTHQNTVNISKLTPIPDRVDVVKKSIEKKFDKDFKDKTIDYTTNSGDVVKLPYYRFMVDVTNLQSDELIIDDEFDTELFEIYNGDWRANQVVGGPYYNPDGFGPVDSVVTALKDPDDNTIGARFKVSEVPKTESGAYCAKYRLVYYLKVKDDVALKTLQERAATNGGKTKIKNIATWDKDSNDVDFDFEHKVVDKTVENLDGDERKVKYTIVINKDKAELGNDDMTLEDTFQNQSIDYTSVKILINDEEVAGNGGITYDFSGYTGWFEHIPDKTKVTITYEALVTGAGTVEYSNRATLDNKYYSETDEMKSLGSKMEGDAIFPYVWLYKYEKSNMSNALAGAVFRLLDSDKVPVKNIHGNEITFPADTNGKVMVYLHNDDDGMVLDYDTVYYLEEITPPPGYGRDYTLYSFIITDQANYNSSDGVYVYYIGDILKVSDSPAQAQLTLSKQLAGNEELTEEQRNAITFTITWISPDGTERDSTVVTYDKMYTYNEASAKNSAVLYVRPTGLWGMGADGTLTNINSSFKLKPGTYSIVESNQNQGGYMCETTYRVDGDSRLGEGTATEVTVESVDIENNTEHDVVFVNTYNSYVYRFEKVDSDAFNNTPQQISHLKDATFTVYKWDESSNDWVESGIEYTTPRNGTFTVQLNKQTKNYTYNTAYKLVETVPPPGYELPVDPTEYYFYFSDDDVTKYPVTGPSGFNSVGSGYVDLMNEGPETVYVGNDKQDDEHTKITAKKVWKSGNTDVTSTKTGAINFNLWQVATTTNPSAVSNVNIRTGQWNASDGYKTFENVPNGSVLYLTVTTDAVPTFKYWSDYAYNAVDIAPEQIKAVETVNIGGQNYTKYKLTFTVTGNPSDITIDVAHRSQNPDNVVYDCSWEYAPTSSVRKEIYDSYTILAEKSWTLELEGLPKQVTNNDGSITTYTYYIEETSTGNFEAEVDIGDETKAIGRGVITLTNTLTGIDFKIIKKNEEGDEINGAEFQLLKKNSNSEYVSFTNSSLDANGKVTVNGNVTIPELDEGEYMLKETKAPSDEYVLADDLIIYFKIEDGEVVFTDSDGQTITEQKDVTFANETVTVTNHKGYQLPHTGGYGTKGYRAVGAIMIVIALLSVFYMRRREGRCDG